MVMLWLQGATFLPQEPGDYALWVLAFSNALLWDKVRQLSKRFDQQFEERPRSREEETKRKGGI